MDREQREKRERTSPCTFDTARGRYVTMGNDDSAHKGQPVINLFSVSGMEIRAHYSALFVFGALASVIAYGLLPELTPAASSAERLAVALLVSLLLSASILLHEFGHALVALRRGKAVAGITLYFFGGAAHICEQGLTPGDDIAIFAAGPAVSVFFAVLFGGAGAAMTATHRAAASLLFVIGAANALLAAFNLLPGLPMDGGRILRAVLWKLSGNVLSATRRAALAGRLVAYCLSAAGCYAALRGNLVAGIWGVSIGWFLAGLAQAHYRTTLTRVALDGLRAGDVCVRDLPTLQTSDSLAQAALLFAPGAKSRTLAVLFGERPAGLFSDVDLGRGQRGAADATVGALMTRAADLPAIDTDDDALQALEALGDGPAAALLVEHDGAYAGLIRREDVARYVDMVEAVGKKV